ncbi:flagellar hook protein (plasmid) [Azospirillum sp. B510]|uniref:flagellar hook protein FlgE n=1 Tax=Azospirillum sp. (strain B510) TaxID=137722 RepID=UPI0001C4CDA1|nr:flagellar hook protein FlgE [Azospirillum sp. B510]BAI76423.1 flagellar hook protein [Azospirillum sp. B510]
MSLYSAMRSGVSGMAAQSSRLAAISDNISNSQTVGYKRATVDFSTLVTAPGDRTSYSASGVQSNLHYQMQQDGTLLGTGSSTDMAISGDGFFVVGNRATGTPDYALTRAGSFLPDDGGFLRNTAGQYLQGWKLDPNGNLGAVNTTRFDDLKTINVGNLAYGGSRTTKMGLTGNLPAQATAGTNFTTTTTFYDSLGEAKDIQLNWKMIVPPDSAATPTPIDGKWELTVTPPGNYTVTPTGPQSITFASVGPNAGMMVDGSGNPLGSLPFTITSQTSTTSPTPDSFTLNVSDITQLRGDYVPQITADGAKAGRVTSVNVDGTGKLWALYDNGARQALYQVPVANVTNPDGLVAQTGNTFTLGRDSGTLTLSAGNSGKAGSVVGSALEQSNVDIATELVSLIETQRAYSSSATLVRTTDEMVEETTRLKR